MSLIRVYRLNAKQLVHFYWWNSHELKKHGSPSECGTALSTDDNVMLSSTYKSTEDSNTHSHHDENLKLIFFL